MAGKIINGKEIAESIQKELASEVSDLKAKGIQPGLAVILVGDNPASRTYVRNKEKACERIGVYSEVYRLPETTSEKEVLDLISTLNNKPEIHGILVQLPLPSHIQEKACIEAIHPSKDVDGFHPVSVGRLLIGEKCFVPCTPRGIIELLERVDTPIKGAEAVVIGRSNIVGKPIAALLTHRHATVTICHSRTRDLAFHTKRADILVVAIGRPKAITGDMVKPGATVIDVGINSVDGKIVGDVDFDSASGVAGAITPVPRGVGPMTITMLMKNTIEAAKA